MSYRVNVTDREQNILEAAAFENGIPVHDNAQIKVIAEGNQTGTERVAHSAVANHINSNAGVVMPLSDQPGRFTEVLSGKR